MEKGTITNRELTSADELIKLLGKENLLPLEEEMELIRQIQAGGEESEQAQEKLKETHLRFVAAIAKQYLDKGLTLEELITEGNKGLLVAADKFGETRGFKFISYAVWWIRQSIEQAVNTPKGMKIKFKEKDITSYAEWEKAFVESKTSEKGQNQWKEGRSACTLAKFIMQHGGQGEIETIVSAIIGKSVTFQSAVVEHIIAFDDFSRGSHRDLTIEGLTNDGKTVFITVEAKVDEEFDNRTINDYYNNGQKPYSKQRPRLELLCQRLMGKNFEDVKNKGLKYQLLHSAVATLDGRPAADYHIMLVLVFNTESAEGKKQQKNHEDYLAFLEAIGATQENVENIDCHRAFVAERNLQNKNDILFVYKNVEANGWQQL